MYICPQKKKISKRNRSMSMYVTAGNVMYMPDLKQR